MARKSRRLDSDMTQGSIWRQLIEFSLPMMIGLIFQQFIQHGGYHCGGAVCR